MKFLISILFTCLTASFVLGQENEEAHVSHEIEKHPKNIITGSFGYTWIPGGASEDASEATGFFVPTIGLEYTREINHKFSVGIVSELELGQYLIFDQDLPRERAFLLLGQGYYSLPRNWIPFLGLGWEHDIHADIFVSRLGIAKKYNFGNEWEWGFMGFVDLKRNYNTWSIMLFVGKLW